MLSHGIFTQVLLLISNSVVQCVCVVQVWQRILILNGDTFEIDGTVSLLYIKLMSYVSRCGSYKVVV